VPAEPSNVTTWAVCSVLTRPALAALDEEARQLGWDHHNRGESTPSPNATTNAPGRRPIPVNH
jgi:hypothetical protein